MIFSSVSFLFFFLVLLIIVYYIVPRKLRNYVLLVFSLIFYFFGEKWNILILLFSCLINYIFGLLIEKYSSKSKLYLIIGIIINISLLFYFKYTNFFLDILSNIFKFNKSFINIALPLGISFFTFQNISYLVDVYRKEVKCQNNFFSYATYITLFPQLIAGPIVRYKDIMYELDNRKESVSLFSEGITRFIIGLSKKVLIADTLYAMYNDIMRYEMSMLSYIIVALGFTLQIYYDFSGYSDMAIGLGKMFGFNFKENFNYPLIASSITDFWRRWHMSLSSFFRDYIYIPLGGNRCSKIKNIRNIFIVWFLTGFWHGAGWNYIIWGLYFFVFLIIEKFFLKKYLNNGILSHIYTFIIVLISFIIFSIEDLNMVLTYIKGLFDFSNGFINKESLFYFKNNFILIVISMIGIGPFLKNVFNNLMKGKYNKLIECLSVLFIMIIFILSIAKIISSSFNPFIYFRF